MSEGPKYWDAVQQGVVDGVVSTGSSPHLIEG